MEPTELAAAVVPGAGSPRDVGRRTSGHPRVSSEAPPRVWAAATLPCVGRERELRWLDDALRQALQGQGSCWITTGPAGMGKSRLLREIRTLALRRGFDVRWGTGIAESTEPLFVLSQTSANLPRARSDARSGLRPGANMGEGSDRAPDRSGRHEPVDSLLLDLLREWESSSAERPLLLLLDDLQWSDAESLRGFRLLLSRVHLHRWVVIAAARTGPTSWEGSRLGVELGDAARSGLLRHLELPPLLEEDRLRLAALLLGEPVDVARRRSGLAQILRSIGGTPYYLVETVAALPATPGPRAERPTSPATRRGQGPRGPAIPTVVSHAILDRYRELPRDDRRLLHLAAYLGHEFDVDSLAVAAGLPEAAVLRRLAPYARFGWPIRGADASGRRYSFDHELLPSVVLEHSPGPDRRTLVRLISWWSRHRPSDRATEIRLRTAVGDHLGALRVLEIAAGEAAERGAYRSAVDLLSEVPLPPHPSRAYLDRRIALQVAVVRRLRTMLEWDVLERALDGLARLPIPADTAWLARCWGLERLVTRSTAEASRELARLRQDLRAAGRAAPAEARRMVEYLEGLQGWSARHAEAQRRRILRTIARLEDGRHDFERMRLRIVEALLLLRSDRPSDCVRVLREIQRIGRHRSADYRRLREVTIGIQADVALQRGDAVAALRFAHTSLTHARRHRRPLDIAWALQLVAGVEFQLRLIERSRAHYLAAEEILARFESKPHLLLVAHSRGWCHTVEGDWAAAHVAFEEADARLPGFHHSYLPRLVATGRALVRAVGGDPEAALRLLPPPQRRDRESPAWGVEYWCSRSRILEIAGDRRGARHSLERAWACARKFGIPWDHLEVAYSFAEWARRQGLPSLEARWRRRFALLPYTGPPAIRERWRGVATAEISRLPDHLLLVPETGVAPSSRVSLRTRILALLSERREPLTASPGALPTGVSERTLAEEIGVPRSALARGLGRLLESGRVERRSVRLPGSARRVYLYRAAESR